MAEPRFASPTRHITFTVHEDEGTALSHPRKFDAVLFRDGAAYVTGRDDESWITFSPDSVGAVLLSAILDPMTSTIDQPRLSPLHWASLPE